MLNRIFRPHLGLARALGLGSPVRGGRGRPDFNQPEAALRGLVAERGLHRAHPNQARRASDMMAPRGGASARGLSSRPHGEARVSERFPAQEDEAVLVGGASAEAASLVVAERRILEGVQELAVAARRFEETLAQKERDVSALIAETGHHPEEAWKVSVASEKIMREAQGALRELGAKADRLEAQVASLQRAHLVNHHRGFYGPTGGRNAAAAHPVHGAGAAAGAQPEQPHGQRHGSGQPLVASSSPPAPSARRGRSLAGEVRGNGANASVGGARRMSGAGAGAAVAMRRVEAPQPLGASFGKLAAHHPGSSMEALLRAGAIIQQVEAVEARVADAAGDLQEHVNIEHKRLQERQEQQRRARLAAAMAPAPRPSRKKKATEQA